MGFEVPVQFSIFLPLVRVILSLSRRSLCRPLETRLMLVQFWLSSAVESLAGID